jgi:phosphoglycolate phosphatase
MGFNFSEESFEDLSVEFVANYRELQHGAALHTHSSDLLHAFRQRGFTQVILSAMERNTLLSDVRERGIEDFFTDILGPGDHYAKGKAGVAKEYLHTRKIPPDQIVILGDTFHDFEVSSDLGCDCILIAQGHHAESKLRTTGSHVQKNLAGVLNLLINP